jgi:hypothetical protein
MERRVQDLATRFREAWESAEADRAAAEERRAVSRQQSRAARELLLRDLASFARTVGPIGVQEEPDLVVWTLQDQRVAFLAEGDGDLVRVRLGQDGPEGENEPRIRLFRHPALHGGWAIGVLQDGVEVVEPLVEAGLVHLLTVGLGMPMPAPATPAAQPGLDDLVP